MMSREEHLAWCKARALAYVDDRPDQAVASMLSDLTKWDGGPLYQPSTLAFLAADGMHNRHQRAEVRRWIEGFQ